MATQHDKTTQKIVGNRNEPARQSGAARGFSESRALHENRGAIQSKLARSQGNVTGGNQRFSARAQGGPQSADTLLPLSEAKPKEATYPVHLRLVREGARSVCVAGSFNDWQPDRTPLRRDSKGTWKTDLQLSPGEYEYRFVVDGEWSDDPLASQQVANPFGGMNAVLRVHGR